MIRFCTLIALLLVAMPGVFAQNQVILSGGSLIQTGGNMVVQDANFVNNGSLDQRKGKLIMSGSAAESQSLILGDSTIKLQSLQISKPLNNAGLDKNISVCDSLVFTSGKIDVNTFVMTLSDTAEVAGADSLSYVLTSTTGTVRRPVADMSAFFPVGQSFFNPLTIENGGAPDTFDVRVFDPLLSNGETGMPIDTVLNVGWNVESGLSPTLAQLTFQWYASQEIAPFDRDSVQAARYNGSEFVATGAAGAASGNGPFTFAAEPIASNGIYTLFSSALFCVDTSVLYVDSTAAPGGDGLSWATAFQDLQSALNYPCSYDTILVAQGTYYPTVGSDRSISFAIPDSVVLLGGYPSGGGTRDFAANTTILSGDIDQTPDSLNNSYHVVRTTSVSAATELDGFTVTEGNANVGGNSEDGVGGGMLNTNNSSPTTRNTTFRGNTALAGGGMANIENSSPTITNTLFSGNTTEDGAGMLNQLSSSPMITNTIFIGNSAIRLGGAMTNSRNSSPTITNIIFSGNTALAGGGMANIENSSPSIINSTFSGNAADTLGGAIVNVESSSPTITNTIIWNNRADGDSTTASASIFNDTTGGQISTAQISYSIIANSGGSGNIGGSWNAAIGVDGDNNKDVDPLFITPISPPMLTTAGDLRLRSYSPAINMGSNDSIMATGVMVDLDSTPRIQQDIVDMGAYEQPGITCPSSDTTVDCSESTDTSALGSVQDLVVVAPDSFFVQSDSSGFDGVTCDNDTIGRITRSFIIADTSNGDRDTICTQRISVIDTSAPVITFCPDSIRVNVDEPTDTTALGFATADDCTLDSIAFRDDIIGFENGSQLGIINRVFIAVDVCGRMDSCTQQIEVIGIQPRIRMYLSGPLGMGATTNTLMWDSLRSKGLIPLTTPFGTGEMISDSATTLSDMGDNSIVDWVLVELRDKDNFATVQASRSALLQRDGDVVDTNGMEGVSFDTINSVLNTDSFYVAVRHRNHLGVMTATARDLTQPDTIDFTDVNGDFYNQGFAPQDSIHSPNVFALWSGDANADSRVEVNSDEPAVRQKVLSAPSNQFMLLNYVEMIYATEDVNMDGSVIYAGQNNDIDVILDAIYRHPQNVMQEPGFVIPEQLPGS